MPTGTSSGSATRRLDARRLPLALAVPLGLEVFDAGELVRGEGAIGGSSVGCRLFDSARAGGGAVDAGVGDHEAQRRLAQRLPWALEEAELLDARQAELQLVAARPAPLLVGRQRLSRGELSGQQATRQRGADHNA